MYLVCTQRQCEISKDIVDNYRAMFETRISAERTEKLPYSQVCTQIVLKCLYLARIGRLDILWSVNKFARSITKWTKACDKRLARLISYIHHTCDFEHYCHMGNTAQKCRLGLFQDSDFAGDLEDSKSTTGGRSSFLFLRKPNMCAIKLDVQKLNLSLLTQVYAWMEFPLSIFGT